MNLSNEVKEVTISVITKRMSEFDDTELWLEEIANKLTVDKIVEDVKRKYPIEELKASLVPYVNDRGYIFGRYEIEIMSKAIGVVDMDYFLDDVITDLIEHNVNFERDTLETFRSYGFDTSIRGSIGRIGNSWSDVIPS